MAMQMATTKRPMLTMHFGQPQMARHLAIQIGMIVQTLTGMEKSPPATTVPGQIAKVNSAISKLKHILSKGFLVKPGTLFLLEGIDNAGVNRLESGSEL